MKLSKFLEIKSINKKIKAKLLFFNKKNFKKKILCFNKNCGDVFKFYYNLDSFNSFFFESNSCVLFETMSFLIIDEIIKNLNFSLVLNSIYNFFLLNKIKQKLKNLNSFLLFQEFVKKNSLRKKCVLQPIFCFKMLIT